MNPCYRRYTFRIYPSKAQRKLLETHLEICRNLYNQLLEINNEVYDKHHYNLSGENTVVLKYLRLENPEWNAVNGQVLQDVCQRLTSAFRHFFRRIKNGEKAGFPRYKSKERCSSMEFTNQSAKFISNNRLNLSRIGPVKIKIHRDVSQDVKFINVSVKRSPTNKWYASVCYELLNETQVLAKTNKKIGIDLGISSFITTSENEVINKPNHMLQSLPMIRKICDKLNKCEKDSKKRAVINNKLGRLYEKVNNRRWDFLHKLSRKLVNENDVICVENLCVEEMITSNKKTMNEKQSYNLNCSIADASWSAFIAMLSYKAEEAGRKVVMVNSRNTTKECSGCGTLVHKKLKQKIHKCPTCGLVLGRDHNAAKNILRLGTQSLASSTA